MRPRGARTSRTSGRATAGAGSGAKESSATDGPRTPSTPRPTTTGPQTPTGGDFPYDVALSYASEQRQYVEKVAELLTAAGKSVFYDGYEKVRLWGKNLYDHLTDIYQNQAGYVVLFASTEYASKAWTNLERQNAQARALREKREYILPVRFDQTEIPGLTDIFVCIDISSMAPNELASMIVDKLASSEAAHGQGPPPANHEPVSASMPASRREPRGHMLRQIASKIARFSVRQLEAITAGIVAALIAGSILARLLTGSLATPTSAAPTRSPTPPPETPTLNQTPALTATPVVMRSPDPSFARWNTDAPAMPTGLGVSWLGSCDGATQAGCERVRIIWEEQYPPGVTVRVYALTNCLGTGTCVTSTLNPQEDLRFVGEAPAAQGSLLFTMRKESSAYYLNTFLDASDLKVYAYLVQAVNIYGGSELAIAESIVQPTPAPTMA